MRRTSASTSSSSMPSAITVAPVWDAKAAMAGRTARAALSWPALATIERSILT